MTGRTRMLGTGRVLAAASLLFWPVVMEAVAWESPRPPVFASFYAAKHALAAARRLELAGGEGPEAVAPSPGSRSRPEREFA